MCWGRVGNGTLVKLGTPKSLRSRVSPLTGPRSLIESRLGPKAKSRISLEGKGNMVSRFFK